MSAPTVLVMAAGQGTRMRSAVPKVLHEVCGRPMVAWPIIAAREAGAERVAVIVSPDRDISAGLPEGTETVVQEVSDGTGGAIRAALEIVRASSSVIVLSGDVPLISTEVISELLATHDGTGAVATVLTAFLDDPGTYGRVIRGEDGDLDRIVEAKAPGDATAEELLVNEINTGTYVFSGAELADALTRITNDNAQGEYYLGDVLPLMGESGRVVAHVATDAAVNLGVNNRVDLALVTTEAKRRLLERHMLAGVTILAPESTWIDADVEIGEDVILEPGTTLRGKTKIGAGCHIGPNTTLTDATLGERVSILHSYLVECDVLDDCSVGPFAYLRPQALLREGSKAGTFVEIKNSDIGAGAKVPHLSYIGDADVGARSNIGAGTITANYDGFRKHRTVIGEHVRIGVDTSLVAPVEIGDRAYTAAGSAITEDVPEGALGVARAKQANVEGFAERKAAQQKEQGS